MSRLALALLLTTGGCGDHTRLVPASAVAPDDAQAEAGARGSPGAGTASAADKVPENGTSGKGSESSPAGPIAVLTRVCSPENCQHYLNVFDELPADAQIDRSQGVESGNTQGKVFGNAIYIFDRDENSVTRWTVDDRLRLEKGATVSFQGAGVADACAICNVFSSETHAYMVDSTSGVIVTWNPTTMELVAIQDIPEAALNRGGLAAGFAWPLVTRGRAYLAASWTNYDTLESWGNAGVATFDATVDAPEVTVLEDSRCGVSSAVTPFLDPSGTVYVVGDWSSGLLQIGAGTPAPNPACLLRLLPDGSRFDAGYYVDLLQAAQARAIYGAYGMSGGKLLLNYWPTSEAPPARDAIAADPYAYYKGRGFRYGVLDLSTGSFAEVAAIPPAGAGNNTPLGLDGTSLIQVYPEGNASADVGADLFAISPDGAANKVLAAGPGGDFEMIGRLQR